MELEELSPVRQFNYNHPLKSVDVPPGHPAKVLAFKAATLALFSTSRAMGKGMLQSIVATAPA